MGSNCCKGDAAGKPVVRSGSSVYSRSRAGAKLSERFTSSHNAGGVRLSITSAKTGDSGVYTLQASNAAGKDTTRVRVEVAPDEMPTGDDPPTFLRRLQDLTVKVGTRTRFLVEIVSSTECRVTWYRNDRRLMEAERIALVRDGNFWCADVSAVSVEDAGRWTCTAENIGGRASCSAHLNVLVPKAYKRPEFVEELRALLTEQGTVSLECKVVGVPTPVLRWFKDSREIKAGDVFALTANAEDPTSLGTYTCEAVNCMGRAYSSSKVQVVGRASREGSARPSTGGVIEPPPIFTKELEDQFVRICEPLTLSCQVVVPPWPRSVVWYNKEGKVEASDKYHIIEDGVGGYFIEIQTSEFADEGEWKCVATSAGGRVGISTCYVSMDVPKNYRKPRFMENLQAVLTEEGLVSFECKVVGFPTPVLSWFKDGQELKPGDVYQLTGTNSLGSYCCIAKNFMGQASSSAELTVEDIQNQLNEEEKLQLFSKNQAPKFLQGLKSVEAKIDEPFRFTIKVAIPPAPTVLWYRDEQPVDESSRCHLGNEERGVFFLDIQNLEFMDQAEWKCVAMNDYGQSVTSCFLKLVIPRHYKKPRFLENLQAILSDEGAVNLECKVIGVPQPVLKWYKDGEELKPGDIHRIISGQDGTCCLGTYTCEAQNCMGIAASSASLLGFEDSLKAKNKKQIDDQALQRNLSLSTIHEERTSQMYDTPVGDITLDDKGEISFSFDGKEVSVSLYETPDLTEEEALQIVEMYADQLSENITEHNVVELPPLRFVKETSTSGNLLMEAIIIDVSPEYFTSPEEDLRTEADIEDISIADENGPPQLSLDQDVSGEDYLEKTIALLSEECADLPKKIERKRSDSQKSADDYYSLSRDRSSSAEKKDDDTQILSESELQSFASAHSTEKPKSKSSKPSFEDGQESSDFTKTVLLKEELKGQLTENINAQRQREGHGSQGSRCSSEKSAGKESLEIEADKVKSEKIITENIKLNLLTMSSSLSKVMNVIQIIERDIILKSELMAVAATASRSLEIINSLITPLSEIHSITDTVTEIANESPEIISSLFNRLPQSLRMLEQSLTIVEKCIDFESENKTLVKKTCLLLIEKCGEDLDDLMNTVKSIDYEQCSLIDDICICNIKAASDNILKSLKASVDASAQDKILNEISDGKMQEDNLETKHLHHTQKVLYSLKNSLKSVLLIIEGSDTTTKNLADIKNSEIILDEISTPIQELQNSLEQIESLSVLESNSNFPNYNTEIIETVMNSVLKLRTSFEQLSIGKENKINEVLVDIQEYINDISSQIDLFDERNGKFDILNSDNKLEVLQTMAQILISLENSLPILDTVPTIKINMLEFHKNLTKVLENVIESNDSNKYFTLLEICNAVNRINTSLNNMESRQMLSLAVISNTLRIIKNSVHLTVFDTSLNKSVLKNINDLLLNIEETMNQIEETSINIEPEKVDELSIKQFEKDKLNIVLEHAQKSIVEISKVTSYESVGNLNITHVLENIRPILTEIQCCLASSNINTLQNPESVSDISISSFTETIAHPLHELQQNISILNEIICENARNQENNQLTVFAEPLVHLQTSLEILQNDLISQYDELILSPDIIGSIANSVDNLQSCIVMIQEHDIVEVVDDMSTLADISGIKTTADIILPIDECKTPKIEKVKIEEPSKILPSILQTFSGQALQTIQKHIVNLQSLDIEENLKKIFEGDEKSDFKSLILEIELVNSAIASIWHPIEMGVHRELPISPTQLGLLVRPLNNLQQSLSNVYRKDIPIYEKEITNYTNKFFDILFDLKDDLVNFLNVLQSAVETVDTAIETANKKVAIRQISMKLENLLSECNDVLIDKPVKMEIINLHSEVNKALNSAYFDDIVAEKITEKVNRTLPKIEDEALNFTAHNLNVLSHEAKLVEIFSEIEQNVITLEHCDLNEESATLISNIDKHPQIANITKVDTLTQLDQITGDVVTTIYKELNERTEADLEVIEECFNTFMKELSILDYLIKNLTSPKKIIKSLQVLYVLYRTLNDFKSRYHNKITEEGIISPQVSLLNIEERLKNVQETLIQNISSQSELLFDIPFAKMKDGELFLKSILQSNSDLLLNETYSIILNVIESLKPFDGEWKSNVIEELSTFNTKNITADKNNVSEKYDLLFSFLEEQAKGSSEGPLKQVTEKIINVLQKHEDLKDILGVGSRIILTKCVAECLDILKKDFLERQEKESIEKCITVCNVPKDINIDELLLEISNPLESINTQIMNIRNKLLLASRNDIDITDLGTLETQMNEIRKVNEEIKLCLSNENFLKETYDLILAVELNNKIGLIFNNLKYLENTPCFEIIKALVQPIEEIKQNLCQVISSSKNFIDKKSQNNKAKVEALLQQMEQHIEIIQIVEEVSAVLKLDDLKETASMVRELRDSIVETETATRSDEDKCCLISSDQIQLTDKLQKALTCLHSQALDGAQGSPCLKADICQQVIDVVSDLQDELVQLNNTSLENLPQNTRLEAIEIETKDEKSDKTVGNIEISDNIQSSSQVDQEAKCKYRTSYKDNSEDISPKESMIDMLLQNIQEYTRQDFSEICHEFASILNNEAIKISQEIAQQFCHYADLNDIFCTETKGSSTVSDEKQKIIFELYNNLQNVFTYEPAKLLGEIVVENKLLQFKNVIYSLCKAIENIQNLTITSNAESILSVGIPIDLEPNNILSTKQYEELHPPISETQTISYKTVEEPNERKNGTNSKLLETRQDSKSAQVLDKHKLHTSLNKSDTENEDHSDVTKENKAIIKPEGKLAACIDEYTSEEVKETLKNMPSSCKLEHLLKSYDVANQLLTLCMVTNFNNSNIRDVIEERLDLSIQLNEALIVIREEIFVHTNILQASVEQDAYQRARSVLNNLHDALQSIITVEQPVSFEHVMELDRALTNTDQLGIRANETEENAENLNLLNQIENQETNPSYQEDTDRITGQEINKCDDSLIDPINIEKDSLMISSDHENNISSIRMLEKLMQEINDYIDLSLTNVENSEMLQNNLDEVQSVIIKLKCDFDGTTNETLNETLEDLECNVRSVQLQINEQSAPALLKEACLNLQVIVASLNENELKPVEENALTSKINIIMDNCQDESDHTIKLLNEACIFENSIEFENIISCLDNIKDTMKSLRNNFLGSAETLIEKGIDVIQNLDQVEDKVFLLEKDLDKLVVIDHNIKDNITSAMHSVYATISNMRGAISGIQKKYMYENYGQPSQNFLKSIKNVVIISQLNLDNESSWKQCAKMFRKALNHFEDIKFYINFDRTARIPNDAAFTKIILQEIVSVLDEVQKLKAINSEVVKTIHDLANYVAEKRMLIEERTTLEVKEKIPIFNDLSMKMLKTTEAIKILLQDLEIKQNNSQDQNILLQKKCEVQHIVELNLENADVFSIDEYKHYEDAVKDLIQDGNMLEASTNTVSVLFKDCEKNVDEQVEINREDPSDDPKKIITGDDQALETSVDYKDHENIDVEEIPLQGKTLIKEQTHYTKEKSNQITSQGVHSDLPDRENVGVAIAVKDLIQDGNTLEASTNTVSVLFKDYEKNVDEQVEINREDPCDDPKKNIAGYDQALETSVDYKDHENVDVEEIPLQNKTLIKEQTHYTKEKNNQITSQGAHSDLPDRENVGVAIAVKDLIQDGNMLEASTNTVSVLFKDYEKNVDEQVEINREDPCDDPKKNIAGYDQALETSVDYKDHENVNVEEIPLQDKTLIKEQTHYTKEKNNQITSQGVHSDLPDRENVGVAIAVDLENEKKIKFDKDQEKRDALTDKENVEISISVAEENVSLPDVISNHPNPENSVNLETVNKINLNSSDRQIKESLIGTANVTVLMSNTEEKTQSNLDATTYEKEDNNIVNINKDSQIKQSELLDMSGHATSDTNTTIKLVLENKQTDAVVTKELDLNEQFGTLEILEKTFQSGVLTNKNEIDIKESVDAGSNFAEVQTNLRNMQEASNIEIDIDTALVKDERRNSPSKDIRDEIQENLSLNKIDKDNSKMYDQLQESDLLNENKHTDTLKIIKEDVDIDNHLFLCHVNSTMSEKDNNNENDNERDKEHENEIKTEEECIYEDNRNQIKIYEDDECKQSSKKIVGDNLNSYKNNNQNSNESDDVWNNNENSNSALILNELNDNVNKKEDVGENLSEDHLELNKETECVLAQVVLETSDIIYRDENRQIKVATVTDSIIEHGSVITQALPNIVYLVEDKDEILKTKEEEMIVNTPNDIKERKEKNEQVNDQNLENNNNKIPKDEKEINEKVLSNDNIHDDLNISAEILSIESDLSKSTIEEIKLISSITDKLKPVASTSQEQYCEVPLPSNQENKANEKKEDVTPYPSNEQASVAKRNEIKIVNISNDIADNNEQNQSNKIEMCISMRSIKDENSELDKVMIIEKSEIAQKDDFQESNMSKENSVNIPTKESDKKVMDMYKTLEEKKQKVVIPTSDILEDKNVELSVIPAHTEQASAKIDEDIQLIKTCINTIVETDAETIVCNKTKIETENCQEISRDNTEDLSKNNVNCKIDEELEKDGRLDLENKEAKEDLKYLDGNETQAKNNKNELNSLNKSNLSQEIRKQEENSIQAKHLESEQIIETNKKKEKNNKSGQPALLKDDDKDDVRDIVEEKQKILVDKKNTETGEHHILNESLATENKETFIFDQSVKQNKEIEGNKCKGNEEKQNKNLELVHEHEPEEKSDKIKVVKLDTISVDNKVLTQNGTDSNSENKEVDATKNQTIIEKEYLVLLKETHIEPEEKAKDKVGVNTSDHIFKELLKENDIDEINENNKGLISDEEQTETVQCKKTEYETQTLLSKSNANTSTECSENIEALIDKIETIRTASRDQDDKDATTQNTEDQLSEMFISTQNEEICTDNMIDNEKFVTEKALITNLKDGESVINDQQKMSSQKQDPVEESVKYDEIEIKHEPSLIGIKSEENQERLDVNQSVLQKEKENDKLPVSKKMESEKEIEVKNSFEESNKKHVQEQEKVNKTLNKDDVKEDKVTENEETIKQDTISNNKTGTTSKNKQDEVAAFNIVENSSQINNDYNNVTEDNKMKFLNKNDDENDTSKKPDEVNTIHEQEKKKKVTKKKLKSDKKKLVEKRGNDNEKNVVLKKEDTNEKEEKLDIEKLQQETVGEKQNNVAGEPKDTLLADDEYKQTPTAKNLSNLTMQIEICKQERVEEKNDYKKSYNYEGKVESVTEKHDPKESPLFIDYNKSDYSLDFPRPPNYTPKSYDTDEFLSPELNLTKNSTIYKAQTLIQDYQSRSSYQPNIDQSDNSSTGHSDTQRPLKRPRSSAVSESRSTVSEKRSARDLKRKPVFSTFLTDRTAVESSRVKLTCSILSSSDPTITWYKNGILLDNKHKFRSKCIDGLITLEVLNAVPSDSGEYSCTVDNENGSVTSTANLKVYPSFESSPIPPTFTRSIRDVYHSFENELVLECRIRGQPLPSITWYKDNKPIIVCERYQAHYLADGVCRLTINSPTKEDSGKYTCHAESSIWSDEISHNVLFSGKENSVSPNIVTLEKVHLSRQVVESRKPHFTNVISDYKVVSGGTIGLQVEIKGSPTRVEWLRDGCSVIDTYRNAQTYFDRGIYTLALSDVTERETGLYTCRAWSSHGNVDMNASITVVQANQIDGKPAVIVSRPAKDILISVGEDINISFRVQGEPKPKVFFMKGLRDITYSQRVCKMTSDDYIKFTMKRSVISDAGTYCILARNAYGCDRAFVTVMIRQRASSENLVSDWTYPMDDLAISAIDRNYKAVPDRIPSEPSVVDGGKNWVSLAWPKPDCQTRAPILAYKVESWLIGKEGGARWIELGITPRNSFDAFNLKQEEEYHFRITPRNRYGWGESVQTSTPIGIGLSGDRPEFIEILPGQLKVLVGETATLCCTYKGKPIPEIVWMKNGHDIEEDTNRLKITQSSYKTCLKIDNVKIEDEGRYSCEASNVHGRSSTYARMTVITDRNIWEADAKLKRERSAGLDGEYPPQFTMRLRDRRVQATYPVRLTCQVVGSPTPSIVWFKNAEEVTADDRHSMSQDEYFYTLEIAPTTLDDGGVYEAMARNNSGAISCRCSLVVDKGIRAYIAPEFCCGLEPLYQLREGEELRISAVVEAYPSVGVCWYRDGVRLRPSRRAIMTLDRDGQIELALAAVTARDAGVYTCTASNEVGRVSTSGKVEIISEENSFDNMNAPPIFVSDEASRALYSNEPRFLRKPRSSEAREGDTVIIECEVIGDPKPEVYWLRDFLKPDYYRDAKHFKRIGAGPEYRFEIPHAKLDYTGAYSVVARNVHGEAKAIISLQILARDPNSNQDAHNIRYGRVEEIPRFEKELTDLLCYDGDAIEFECRVSANPDPFIRWFHYTEVIPDCPDFETSYDCGTARLKIKQVTAEDEGTYKCEASNSLGKATSVACLVVYPPGEPNTLSQSLRRPPALLSAASTPRSTPRTTPRTTPRSTPARSLSATPDSRRLCSPSREIAPKFYTYPFNRVAEEGDTVVFQCAVKGLPQPWATWDKDGIIITASSRINIKEKEEMFRILEIEQVTIEDVGLYRITLENDYGRAEASARLEVISGKGKFHGTTRSFSASPSRRAVPFRRRTPSFSRLD